MYTYLMLPSLSATVATERFDVDAFQQQHMQILANVSIYEQVGHVLNVRPAAPSVSSIKSEAPAKVARSVDMATTIPSIDAGKTLSPRNRLAYNKNFCEIHQFSWSLKISFQLQKA